jgi:MATE family multidrug resistance protein
VAAVFQIADGAQVVAAGALRGLGDTGIPMLICGFGYWAIGLPISVLLGFAFGWGGIGIWIGLAAGLLAVAIPMVLRFRRLANG